MNEETKIPAAPAGDKDVEENKVLAAISYLWIISLVILLVKKESAFAKFHAKQGLILWIISMICWVIPIVGWLLNLAVFVFVIVGFIQAISGKWWKAPVIGQLAEKIKI
ncbi:hypothetical protein COT68_01125 [bacterium (Candidatus Torokbacteria) CG09_land_8_20_14_0_10_42_11]|nr:MAG: hypothetical protein COT68_01125 [bacterium (Candidatus Torokbacteria) CG09_land_8_20_14_0_10_42_11]